MRDQDLERVRCLPLFSTMDDDAFDRLAPISYLQQFPAGVHMITEGDSADFLHVVVEGSVELYATGNGRETTVAIVQPVTAFRTMVKTVKNQKLRTAAERLANYLLVIHQQQGASGQIDLPFEKRLLASYLGVTPENLSRAFKTLETSGVRNSRTKIFIEDDAALRKLAQPTALIDTPEEW